MCSHSFLKEGVLVGGLAEFQEIDITTSYLKFDKGRKNRYCPVKTNFRHLFALLLKRPYKNYDPCFNGYI